MPLSRGLSCRRRHIAVLLLLLMLPMVIPPLLVRGSRLTAEERQPRRTAGDGVNMAAPACSSKTNNYTVGGDANVTSSSLSSSSSSGSGVDDSDRLVPTGSNPLHHRHH